MKIAILSGRPAEGTLLPKKEGYVWKEICRILKKEMGLPLFQGATLLIPVYSKFDLQALYYGERNTNSVEYYMPKEDWGTKGIPKHQQDLIARFKGEKHINPSHKGRLMDMIADADVVYCLFGSAGMEEFLPALKGKTVVRFPFEQMRYLTESDAENWHNDIATKTMLKTSLADLSSKRESTLSAEAQHFFSSDSYVPPHPPSLENIFPDKEEMNRFFDDYWGGGNE